MSFQSRMDQIRVWFSNPRSRALLIGSAWSSVLALVMLGWFCQSDRCIYGFGIACLSLTISLFGLAPLLLKKRSTEQNRGVYQKIPQESSNQEQSTFVSRLSRMKVFRCLPSRILRHRLFPQADFLIKNIVLVDFS
eukprot:TRINITY_DN9423_c0_g1_i3.p1 TRINITY_DN9423_c0_g1~~TRINITY_DN9423_c0_g1_i3.p1  ORF type:complete len:136 (+),score=22.82 TRINITY_DN9423_c0_g1_i3:43-450(+)